MPSSRNYSILARPIQVLLRGLVALALTLTLYGQQPPSAGTAQTNLAGAPPTAWDTFGDTWVATDALGRSLPSCSEAGLPRKHRTVGVFYFLWLYPRGAPAPLDIPQAPARAPGASTNAAN